jgi:benzoylformate decarboxylase
VTANPRPEPQRRAKAERVCAAEPLSAAYVLQTLADNRRLSDVFVEEAPTARPVMHAHLPMLHPESFYTMSSGGLGHGMPAAAGIALAKRCRVFCVIGDGSSMYSSQTLWTASQHNLKVVFVVLNNGKYGAMKRFGGVLGFPAGAYLPGTDLPGLDFSIIAHGHGCAGRRVTNGAELSQALAEADSHDGPYLLDVIIE